MALRDMNKRVRIIQKITSRTVTGNLEKVKKA